MNLTFCPNFTYCRFLICRTSFVFKDLKNIFWRTILKPHKARSPFFLQLLSLIQCYFWLWTYSHEMCVKNTPIHIGLDCARLNRGQNIQHCNLRKDWRCVLSLIQIHWNVLDYLFGAWSLCLLWFLCFIIIRMLKIVQKIGWSCCWFLYFLYFGWPEKSRFLGKPFPKIIVSKNHISVLVQVKAFLLYLHLLFESQYNLFLM